MSENREDEMGHEDARTSYSASLLLTGIRPWEAKEEALV